ncbi:serine/threonine/tyrosine protein kinase RAD53 NDAI_0E02110 [Naumovozyma dairenensis CBS 421]|uniref:Serine/threonine-protein kinase RAD53 n=1 Tax=Naumovozyma dairenensis (strain ATCC 10597 / BCRC 20456 / CBS 421 / NBRC 0211 / NRRL Y-12639) TaxID=1071378 RepID=G0WBA8_NAUDC|nr:hypothetical protein NDAI_0E02110 [Naumovozyma dairenensis CBS 421]CCD25028.1 hypothetical protein NDAI_0E02110 [Naumovozyma dairenensis CBS 421]
MDYTTQPTQQATQATQKFLIQKFSQEQIDENIVCRIICTNGTIPIRDLKVKSIATILTMETPIKKIWTFGRNANIVDYHLGDISRLSNKHFQILLGEDGNLLIKDTSTNGTWLNGDRLRKDKNQLLSQGDEITVGVGVKDDILSLVLFINEKFKKALMERKHHGVSTLNSNSNSNSNSEDSKKSIDSIGEDAKFQGIFKDYEIQDEVVGQGAFATVKKAVERSTGKTFAVKIISKRKVMGSNMDGVSRELEVLQRLDHPRIVRLKGFYEDHENYYMLMEFVSGGDLMDFVAAHGAVGEDAGREISRQILEAIKYIHSMGISHRDLKPDNILIEQDDPVLVKITDFGLAKVQDNGTFMKTFCGTLAYVAPEIISGKNDGELRENADANSERNEYSSLVDMWSMGCLVYVILTGHLPFSGSTQKQLYKQISRGSYHEGPLKDFRISDEARDFIDSLLQVKPNDRLTAEKALEHPWIKMAQFSQSFVKNNSVNSVNETDDKDSCFQVSLTDSLSQQKLLENMDDAQYEFLKAQRKEQLRQFEDMNKPSQPKGFKIPGNPLIRYTQQPKVPRQSQSQSQSNEKGKLDNVLKNNPRHNNSGNSKKTKKKADGKFLTLRPLRESRIQESIPLSQGINPFFFGRSDDCNCRIEDSRLSRVHCFILKKRHAVGDSIYESPAQGLDDIWYCHSGSNVSYVNDIKLEQGSKCLLQHGDEIKIICDWQHNFVIGFKVEINDSTGLFNDGMSPFETSKTIRAIVSQTDDEKSLVKRLIQMMAIQRAEKSKIKNEGIIEAMSSPYNKKESHTHFGKLATAFPNHIDNASLKVNNSNEQNIHVDQIKSNIDDEVLSSIEHNNDNKENEIITSPPQGNKLLKRVHSVSLSQSQNDPAKKVKRAKLDQPTQKPDNLQFL